MSTDQIGQLTSSARVVGGQFAIGPAPGGGQRAAQLSHVSQNEPVAVENAPAGPTPTGQDFALIKDLVNRVAARLNRRVDYAIEPGSHSLVVRILDGETNEVVKTIPPEQWLKLAQRFEETLGLLFDELA